MPKPPLPEVCVVYLIRDAATGPEVLLGRKLTGLGEGKIVAPGGKLEVGESPVDAAVREVLEEVGLTVDADDLELLGALTYLFPSKPEWDQVSWAFLAHGDFGVAVASNEMDASWVPVSSLPVDEMWDDAKYWLPDLLQGEPVVATFDFGADLSTVTASDYRANSS
jgi:8-oxo-dGTP diphosphatase